MSHAVESIPPGHPLQSSLQAIYARRGLPPTALVTLRGALDRATLLACPGGPRLPLAGPLFLVHATALPDGDDMAVMAVVSWTDHGLPRMLAGQLDDAISAGVQVALPGPGSAAASSASASRPRAATAPASQINLPEMSPAELPPWEAEPAPAARNARSKTSTETSRPSRSETPAAESDSPHVDLSAEMAALIPNPAGTPAPPKAAAPSGGGWATAVAASKPAAGGRKRASAGARQPPTASDLGFDVDGDPELMRGDVLVHPRFGRCKVIKATAEKVKVRRPSGAFIDLHMKVCNFSRLADEGGKRVFDLRIGRK